MSPAGPSPSAARRCSTWTPRIPTAARGASCANHRTASGGSCRRRRRSTTTTPKPRVIPTGSRSPRAARPSPTPRTPPGPRSAPTRPPRRRRWATAGGSPWTSRRPSCAIAPTTSSKRWSTAARTSTASSKPWIRRGSCGKARRRRCPRPGRRCSGIGPCPRGISGRSCVFSSGSSRSRRAKPGWWSAAGTPTTRTWRSARRGASGVEPAVGT